MMDHQPASKASGATSSMQTLHPDLASRRGKSSLLSLTRIAFGAIFIAALTILVLSPGSDNREAMVSRDWHYKLISGLALALFAITIDAILPNKKLSTITAVVFGLVISMLATLAIATIIDLLVPLYDLQPAEGVMTTIKVTLGISLAYLGVTTVLTTKDDFRLVVPYVEFAKQIRGARPLILDSSVLIDARISDIGATGVIQAPVVIPEFVVAELQRLADSGDRMKRARGRRGLDVIAKLQRAGNLDVTIDETPVPGKAVDQMLIEFARAMPGMIVTTDVGLARVARIQDVRVLNLHDLAGAMKQSVTPGDTLRVRLLRGGEQAGQAVGYLDDGTMIVGERCSAHIGEEVTLEVTSTIQTSAGRMIFACLPGDGGGKDAGGAAVGAGEAERGAGVEREPPVGTVGPVVVADDRVDGERVDGNGGDAPAPASSRGMDELASAEDLADGDSEGDGTGIGQRSRPAGSGGVKPARGRNPRRG